MLGRLSERSDLLERFDATEEEIRFTFSSKRLDRELERLKELGIKTIASLTELHHDKDTLQKHFDLHHLPIRDLEAPQTHQAKALAELVDRAKKERTGLAVHCLAGIGRTSTMLLAACWKRTSFSSAGSAEFATSSSTTPASRSYTA